MDSLEFTCGPLSRVGQDCAAGGTTEGEKPGLYSLLYFLPNGLKWDSRVIVLFGFCTLLWAILWPPFIVSQETGIHFPPSSETKKMLNLPFEWQCEDGVTGSSSRSDETDRQTPWTESMRPTDTLDRVPPPPCKVHCDSFLAHQRDLSSCLLSKGILIEHSFYQREQQTKT